MEPLHAVVKNGRLTLDAPTDRPDGDVVMLISVDDLLGAADGGHGVITLEMPRKRNTVDAAALIRELRSL